MYAILAIRDAKTASDRHRNRKVNEPNLEWQRIDEMETRPKNFPT